MDADSIREYKLGAAGGAGGQRAGGRHLWRADDARRSPRLLRLRALQAKIRGDYF